MLASKNRLTKKKDFEKIFKNGQKVFNKFFGLRYLIWSIDYPRFVIVVSNKVSKQATKRNQLKRRLREIVRLNFENLNLRGDFIINVLPPAINLDYHQLKKEISSLFKKIK